MLLVMSYNGGVFFVIVLGGTIGHFISAVRRQSLNISSLSNRADVFDDLYRTARYGYPTRDGNYR